MNNPLVSIIIPTYNRAHLIGETLDSVLAQTYQNWECIIVDDESTDTTTEVVEGYLKKDSRFKYYTRPKERRKGANACRNYGKNRCLGDFIQFFDSDDILDSRIVKTVISLFGSNVDFVYFNYLVFYKGISNIIYNQINNSKEPFLDYFSGKINLATPAVIWKRSVIIEINFDENLNKSQELNFCFNIFKENISKSLNGVYLNENGFLVRKHEESIVSSFLKAKTIFLLSDIKVRNQILSYFDVFEHPTIYCYQRLLIENSIRLYLFHSNLIDFWVLFLKFHTKKKIIGRLLFYKIVYRITNREHRFNKTINQLFKEEFYLKM